MRKFGLLLAAGLAAIGVSAQAQNIGIGLDIPLSAPGDAAGGQMIRRGAEIGIDMVNAAGGVLGKKLELFVTDSQSAPAMGVANYRRLVGENKVVAVTGFFHSSVALGINEVAKEMGVPTLAVQASASDITAKHYDIAFRTHAVDPVRVAAWMEFIKKKGFKKISIIAETTDYGIGLTDETIAQNKSGKAGLDIQKITFDNKATDFTPQLLQIKSFKPDLVLNIGVGTPVDLIMDQATTIGLLPTTPMLISYDAPTRPQYWQLHPKNGEGIYFIAYYSPKSPLSDLGQAFAKAYKEKYKEDPVYGALNGFGAIEILAQGLKAANSTDPKALIKALESGTFKSWPDAPVTFPRADGVYWHNWVPPVLIVHYTKPNQDWKEADIAVTYSKK
ncbi:MAG: ABC transporter substrate-binding protein [Proteobacteria bacterium]|nr:ABC transporter substrate-binding protein [Pseudomonadota bacterium]MBS0549795.1 ABC transporter substrate-binding protein [Pseudomonadota bacterium]